MKNCYLVLKSLAMNLSFRISLCCLLSLQQLSCNNAGKPPASKPVSTKQMEISNEGVPIDYTDSKAGDTVLLFIHGWGINKEYWADQIAYFGWRYRVVAVDLPGFGRSGKNRKSWTAQDFGKDIGAVMAGLDLKNVILVGHSMSGAVAVETALQNPGRVIGLVGVDNFKNLGYVEAPADKAEAAKFYKGAREHFRDSITAYINQALFSPSTNAAVRQRVVTDMTGADSLIAVEALERVDAYPLYEKLVAYQKPLYLINSSFTPTDTAAFSKKQVRYFLFDMGPTGHYPMIEKPDTFNVLLSRAIEKIGTGGGLRQGR